MVAPGTPRHGPERAALDDCVHCGFCLPACPTYDLWGEEMDSPRGRIVLMDLLQGGEIRADATVTGHFDACLGCMACVTACPSGVRYGDLIEDTRALVEDTHTRTPGDRAFRAMLFWLFPHPRRLRVATLLAWLYQRSGVQALARRNGLVARLPARLRALEALLPPLRLGRLLARGPRAVPAAGSSRLRVGVLDGCVQSVLFDDVRAATLRVLAAEGCDIVVPASGCCGALHLHTGLADDAAARARTTIAAFEAAGVDRVVVTAAGCGSSMKDYGRILAADPAWAERATAFVATVRDVTELLAELDPIAPRHRLDVRVAYQDACHLAHAQGVRAQPRTLLRAIPGLEVVDLADDTCCGSAGVYNLVQPEPAEELGQRKAAAITATGARIVATGNPGCALQLQRYLGTRVRIVHPVQLLDASIRDAGRSRR